jgi:Arc/MetJ-type ribon-helix-helix transcriptional regulator
MTSRKGTRVLTVRLPDALMQRLELVLESDEGWIYASRTHMVQCALREWLDQRCASDATHPHGAGREQPH